MAQYIDKDALAAEIERLTKSPILYKSENVETRINVLEYLLSFLNTLEIKEVDLEKEINNQIRLLGGVHTMESGTNWYKGSYSELAFFAKYFFELGLKAQKRE